VWLHCDSDGLTKSKTATQLERHGIIRRWTPDVERVTLNAEHSILTRAYRDGVFESDAELQVPLFPGGPRHLAIMSLSMFLVCFRWTVVLSHLVDGVSRYYLIFIWYRVYMYLYFSSVKSTRVTNHMAEWLTSESPLFDSLRSSRGRRLPFRVSLPILVSSLVATFVALFRVVAILTLVSLFYEQVRPIALQQMAEYYVFVAIGWWHKNRTLRLELLPTQELALSRSGLSITRYRNPSDYFWSGEFFGLAYRFVVSCNQKWVNK